MRSLLEPLGVHAPSARPRAGGGPPSESKIHHVGNRQLGKLQEPCDLRKHTAWEVNEPWFSLPPVSSPGTTRKERAGRREPSRAPGGRRYGADGAGSADQSPAASFPPGCVGPWADPLTSPNLCFPICKRDHKNLFSLSCWP